MKTLYEALEMPMDALYEECGVAMLLIDATGHISTWSAVATSITGLPEDDALGAYVWDVAARVAPAWIPYEIACSTVRGVVHRLPAVAPGQSTSPRSGEHQRFHGAVLSATGETHAIEVDLFPLRTEGEDAIACLLCRADQPVTKIPQQPAAARG